MVCVQSGALLEVHTAFSILSLGVTKGVTPFRLPDVLLRWQQHLRHTCNQTFWQSLSLRRILELPLVQKDARAIHIENLLLGGNDRFRGETTLVLATNVLSGFLHVLRGNIVRPQGSGQSLCRSRERALHLQALGAKVPSAVFEQ